MPFCGVKIFEYFQAFFRAICHLTLTPSNADMMDDKLASVAQLGGKLKVVTLLLFQVQLNLMLQGGNQPLGNSINYVSMMDEKLASVAQLGGKLK